MKFCDFIPNFLVSCCIQQGDGAKGVIEVENPNHVKNKLKKADDITADGEAGAAPELSRRERSVV